MILNILCIMTTEYLDIKIIFNASKTLCYYDYLVPYSCGTMHDSLKDQLLLQSYKISGNGYFSVEVLKWWKEIIKNL